MYPSRMHGSALALLLAASANEVRATRVRKVRDGLHGGESVHPTPWTPTWAASAVVDLFETRGGPNSTNSAFQAECVGLVTAKVDHLDEAWSDVHVKAVLNTECVDKKLFLAASGNRSAEHQDCIAFAGRLAGARRVRITNGTAAGYTDFCKEYSALALERRRHNGKVLDPHASKAPSDPNETEKVEALSTSPFLIQLIVGIVYYFMVVSKYPMLPEGDIPEGHPARELQDKNELTSLPQVSTTNCLMSFCCPAVRAAHTFHSTETMNYWASLCIMLCCPLWGICGMLCIGNSCTSMNKKLGGEARNPFMGVLCAWFCQCCVIAQDAESMDLLVGARTGFCSVTKAEA